MDVGLEDDQRQLRDAARDVLSAKSPSALTRECYEDPDRWHELWPTLVELGWTGVGWPEADARGDALDLVVLLEQTGAATLPAPLVSTIGLAAGALRAAGDAGVRYAEELATGTVATLACGELGGTDDLRLDAGRLTGRVGPVRDGSRAELFVALAADAVGACHVAVCRAGAGVTVTPAESVDPSVPVASVELDVMAETVAPVVTTAALAVPLVAAAAELVGVAERALAISVEHARTRHQFGQPIGAFQGVKHRLADGFVSVERARSLTWLAATMCTAERLAEPVTWRAALLAKAAAAEAAALTATGAVAVHGAIGQTWEHHAHLLLRRAWLGGAWFGDSATLYAMAGREFAAAGAAR